MEKKSWKSPQAVIVMVIIILLFFYIGIDAFIVKPNIRSEIKEVKTEYDSLSTYLINNKIPEIDSTLKSQSIQIQEQSKRIDTLKASVKVIAIN